MTAEILADIALERSYLGHTLMDATALDVHPVRPGDFYGASHATVLDAMLRVHVRGEPVNIVSVHAELDRARELVKIGGDEFLMALVDGALTGGAVVSVASRLLELSDGRAKRDAARAALAAYASGDTVAGDAAVLEMATHRSRSASEPVTLAECAAEVWRGIGERAGVASYFVTTGIQAVDRTITGLSPGSMLVLGGDTGVGKSSAGLAMAFGGAEHGIAVGVVSAEDPRDVWGSRSISMLSGVSSNQIRSGRMSRDDFARGGVASDKLRDLPVFVADVIGGTDVDVVAAMTSLVKHRGCRLVIVDYLQTINPSERSDSRREDIRRIASRIKAAAARLGCAVVLVSQLSRPGKDEVFREPMKHHLKESGDIENMAEVIVLLWRTDDRGTDISAKIAKSKYGGDGVRFVLHRDGNGVLREVCDGYVAAESNGWEAAQ